MDNVVIYDNGGETLDRYTVIIEDKEGEKHFYGMSENALGFNLYCGSSCDGYQEGSHLGKIVEYDTLSQGTKDAILDRLEFVEVV